MLAFDIDKFPSAKLKLEQYFLEWLLLEGDLIIDDLWADINLEKINNDNEANSSSSSPKTTTGLSPSTTSATTSSTAAINANANNSNVASFANAFSRSPKKRTQSEMLYTKDSKETKDDGEAMSVVETASATSITNSINNTSDSLSPHKSDSSAVHTPGSKSPTTTVAVAASKNTTLSVLNLSPSDHDKTKDERSPPPSIDKLKYSEEDHLLYSPTASKLGGCQLLLYMTGSSRRRNNTDIIIPKFYFPGKVKYRNALAEDHLSKILPDIEAYFKPFPDGIPAEKFVGITKKLCGIPSFFNMPFCRVIHETYGLGKNQPKPSYNHVRGNSGIVIKLTDFLDYWRDEVQPYNRVERFFRVIKQQDVNYISKDDFVPFLKELLHFHPGLDFLANHDEFKRKYALTVITRIFFKVNTSRTGKITLREVKNSNLFQEFVHVDEETDINKVTEYFSYEHFYVLYCRFFELDTDRDGKLRQEDLARYGDFCLSEAINERLFRVGMRAFSDGLDIGFNPRLNMPLPTTPTSASALASVVNNANLHFNNSANSSPRDAAALVASNAASLLQGGMTYPDFVYFMLAEEDKTSVPAIKFWFHCCDMDADGKLSYNDMWHFYRIQLDRVASVGHDAANFRDVLCQMLDYLHPVDPLSITLEDMIKPDKRVSSGLIFDLLFNMHKFMRFEMRDPFQEKLKREDGFGNDWNRFAYFEYIKLASEEEAAAEQGEGQDNDDHNYMEDGDDNNIDDLDDETQGAGGTAVRRGSNNSEGSEDSTETQDDDTHYDNTLVADSKDNSDFRNKKGHQHHQQMSNMFYDDDEDVEEMAIVNSSEEKGFRNNNGDTSLGDLTMSAGAIDLGATQMLRESKAEPRFNSNSNSDQKDSLYGEKGFSSASK